MCNVVTVAYMLYEYGFHPVGYISPYMCYAIGWSFQLYVLLDGLDGK